MGRQAEFERDSRNLQEEPRGSGLIIVLGGGNTPVSEQPAVAETIGRYAALMGDFVHDPLAGFLDKSLLATDVEGIGLILAEDKTTDTKWLHLFLSTDLTKTGTPEDPVAEAVVTRYRNESFGPIAEEARVRGCVISLRFHDTKGVSMEDFRQRFPYNIEARFSFFVGEPEPPQRVLAWNLFERQASPSSSHLPG